MNKPIGGFPVFFSPQKPTYSNLILILNDKRRNTLQMWVDGYTTMKSLFSYLFIFIRSPLEKHFPSFHVRCRWKRVVCILMYYLTYALPFHQTLESWKPLKKGKKSGCNIEQQCCSIFLFFPQRSLNSLISYMYFVSFTDVIKEVDSYWLWSKWCCLHKI